MKAAVLENNKFVIKNIEKPQLKNYDTGAVVKILGCGLCGSDIVKLRTGIAKEGSILGHEAVGEIVEINTKTNFKCFDKIALGHHVPCFKCKYCRSGNYSMCRHFKSTNIVPGGFCEYIYVSEEHLNNTVFKINDNLTNIEASFLEPLGCCIRAVKRAEIKKDSKILIIGLGSIGLLMGQAVKAYGHDVYGCDLKAQRVELSKKYGFNNSFISENQEETLKNMNQTAPDGFDTIFLTAGAASTLDFAVKSVRDGGTIIVFSSVKDFGGFKNNDIYYRELKIMGSYSPSPIDLKDSMSFIESKKVNVKGISTVYNIENLNEAIEDTLSGKIMKAYIQL
ncbi:MAG: alcohol dehydrogenase catalytic domain-containing protein [Candidatus Gastranaerophilales bacterium]|nr:alcohol dehydrogenase catalytic domain-containing protein [Candidatus Gastranaerophilales bacterium]